MTQPTSSTDTDPAPADTYRAAAWLRSRHPWLDELLTRVTGPAETDEDYAAWLDELVEGFNELPQGPFAAHSEGWWKPTTRCQGRHLARFPGSRTDA